MILTQPRSKLFPYTTLFRSIRKGKKYLSKFLLTRGIWLVLLEITVVTFGWHFDIYFTELDLQTIWSLGMSMVVFSKIKDRKSTRLNSSHQIISYAVFCLKKK